MVKRKINWDWVIGISVGILFTFMFIKAEGWKALKAPTLSNEEIIELVDK